MVDFDVQQIPRSQQLISILWPSFVTAILASGIFFSAFDPQDLLPFDEDFQLSRLATYSIGFFVFWAISVISSAGTLYFAISNCRSSRNNAD